MCVRGCGGGSVGWGAAEGKNQGREGGPVNGSSRALMTAEEGLSRQVLLLWTLEAERDF